MVCQFYGTNYNSMTKHNFGAGPCILPQTVLQQAASAVTDLDGIGLSVLEISHRSPEFEEVIHTTEALVRELLEVPDDYSVLFLQGGASMQFCMVPMNFLQGSKKEAVYLDGGYFGEKAIKEAKLFGQVQVIDWKTTKDYTVPEDAAYFHCTSNNTIEGTEMFAFPDTQVPIICDMSSDIFSRKIDISRFALVYAGAQKNMGPAGMTLVIVKNSLLDIVKHAVPTMLDYRTYRDHHSLFNTPPVFAIYAAMLNLRWLKKKGGVKMIAHENLLKAQTLYDELDRNKLFDGLVEPEYRSLMNVTFRMKDEELTSQFLEFAAGRGMVGIRGYRTVGGFRASLYNALPYESVKELATCMRDFEHVFALEI